MEITRNWKEKRERGQPIEYEKSNKHEKVNGMVKWNYLGHRRTVDPNKVKGMAKKDRQQRENHHRTCERYLGWWIEVHLCTEGGRKPEKTTKREKKCMENENEWMDEWCDEEREKCDINENEMTMISRMIPGSRLTRVISDISVWIRVFYFRVLDSQYFFSSRSSCRFVSMIWLYSSFFAL